MLYCLLICLLVYFVPFPPECKLPDGQDAAYLYLAWCMVGKKIVTEWKRGRVDGLGVSVGSQNCCSGISRGFLNKEAVGILSGTAPHMAGHSAFFTLSRDMPAAPLVTWCYGLTIQPLQIHMLEAKHLIFFFFNFYWSIVDLQCCVSFWCTAKWISYTYTYIHSFLRSFPIQAITEYWVEFWWC